MERAIATASSASCAECNRPSALSAASSSACTPSETRLMPAARKLRKRVASTLVGLASRLTSTSPAIGQCRATASMTAPTVAGCISDGVPPPKKIVETVRPGRRAAVAAISAAKARAKRVSSTPACRTWLLKSQYGHFDRQNGQWMYRPNAEAARSRSGKTSLRQLQERAGAVREAFPRGRQTMLLYVRHLAECKRVPVRQKHRIVAEAVLAARGPDQSALDHSVELLHVAIGPGEAERAHELRLAFAGRVRAALAQPAFDRLHGSLKVLGRTRPAGRVNTGFAAERIDG